MLKDSAEKLMVLASHMLVVAEGQVNQQLAEVFLNVRVEVGRIV